MNNEHYLIHKDDYIKHIDDKFQLFMMLQGLANLVSKLPPDEKNTPAIGLAKHHRKESEEMFKTWGVPRSYMIFGSEADLAELMENELIAPEDAGYCSIDDEDECDDECCCDCCGCPGCPYSDSEDVEDESDDGDEFIEMIAAMSAAIHNMENKLNYTRNGDYLIPNLTLSETETKPLGKYGRMRKKYLQENRPVLWNSMILSETLFPHLREIDETANRRLEQMMPELMKQNGVTEELKAKDPMMWTGLMNNLKHQAEEVILAELIHS